MPVAASQARSIRRSSLSSRSVAVHLISTPRAARRRRRDYGDWWSVPASGMAWDVRVVGVKGVCAACGVRIKGRDDVWLPPGNVSDVD